MRIKDKTIRAVALAIRPRMTEVIQAKGAIEDADIRAAIIAARRDGEKIPNLTSIRSLQMVEEAIVEM